MDSVLTLADSVDDVAAEAEAAQGIWVEFAGRVVVADTTLSFGRRADLSLDETNSFMHRVVGIFRRDGETWWLENVGSAIRLLVFASDGLRIDLPAGTTSVLSAHTGTISFTAGPTPYELTFRLSSAPDRLTHPPTPGEGATSQFGAPLTAREIDYMIEFARPILSGTHGPLPTYAEVAKVCGVSQKTVDNTLQTLRRKLQDSGVQRIDSLDGLLAHLLATGKLTFTHLLERSLHVDR